MSLFSAQPTRELLHRYYDAMDDPDLVRQVVQARDPVNIALDTAGTLMTFEQKIITAPSAKSYMKQAQATLKTKTKTLKEFH